MKKYEYIVVGMGPAGICAAAKLLGQGIDKSDILLIDKRFTVGEFGGKWKNVPGNTAVKAYRKVNKEIYESVPELKPGEDEKFMLDTLPESFACSLRIAAEPMQAITDKLQKMIRSEMGEVRNIKQHADGLWYVKMAETSEIHKTKRVILATGASPKSLPLPENVKITQLQLEQVSDLSALREIKSDVKCVGIIGSSHSAALAAMHLLQEEIPVIQFIKNDYRYAEVMADGKTKYDNTGLKGDVAAFTKDMMSHLSDFPIEFYSSNEEMYKKHLSRCSHVVFAVGFERAKTVEIQAVLSANHDKKTTEIHKGLFGFGIGFPLDVLDASGQIEQAVGYTKFWNALDSNILNIWDKRVAEKKKFVHDNNATLFNQTLNQSRLIAIPQASMEFKK